MDIAKLRQKIRETQTRRDMERAERLSSPAGMESQASAPEPIEPVAHTPPAASPVTPAPPARGPESQPVPPVEKQKEALASPASPAEARPAVEEADLSTPAPPVSENEDEEVDDYLDEGMVEDLRHRAGEAIKVLAFRLGDEDYAVRLTDMQEVLMYHDVTRLPRTPAYLLGITSLRGKVIPVIDLRERLGIKGPEPQMPRVLVLKSEDEPVGARVDSVTGVIRTWTDEILPALNTLSEEESRFISGVVRVDGRFVSLLELEEILKIELED